MQPTLIDIARETNTSVSTVSRVLAGGATAARISEATRGRVLEAATRLGYRPNLVARSLRTRRSHTVALLVSDIANPWFGTIASLIESALHKHGYSLMLCNSSEDPKRELEYLKLLPAKGIDGLILVPVLRNRKQLSEVLPADLPLVLLDRPIAGVTASVYSDVEQGANVLCDTLERASVKRVGLVSGPSHVMTHRRRGEIVSARFQVISAHEGAARRETGRLAYGELMPLHPDAIICTNNFLGRGVLDAMAESLVSAETPPVVGCFDEIPMSHLLPIPVACSVQDVEKLAEGCVSQLLPQLDRENPPLEPLVLPNRAITNLMFDRMYPAREEDRG